MTRTGRVAFLTNLREKDVNDIILEHKKHLSRGALVKDFLVSTLSPADYLQSIKDPNSYLGFNLVLCNVKSGEMAHLNNSSIETEQGVQHLLPGRCYGLSNGLIGEWRKVITGVNEIQLLINNTPPDQDFPFLQILDLMKDEERDEALRDTPIKEHYQVSSRFIPMTWTGPGSGYYGTRSQTLLCIKKDGDGGLEAELREWTYECESLKADDGASWVNEQHRFKVE